MMQKSNEEIYKALSEAERNLAEKNVGWMDKASKRKENHAAIGKASTSMRRVKNGAMMNWNSKLIVCFLRKK